MPNDVSIKGEYREYTRKCSLLNYYAELIPPLNMKNNIRLIPTVIMCLLSFVCFAETNHNIEKQNSTDDNVSGSKITEERKCINTDHINKGDSIANKIRIEILHGKGGYHELANDPIINRKIYKISSIEEAHRRQLKRNLKKSNPRLIVEFVGGILFCVSAIFSILGKMIIKRTRSVKTAVNLRKTIWAIRAVFVVLFCSIWVYIIYFLISSLWLRVLAILFAVPIAMAFWVGKGWFGNLSFYTKQKFLNKHPRFMLYLRGFGDDELNNDLGLALEGKEKTKNGLFDGEKFFGKIVQIINVCAVGRPQELDAPHGADRVYLDDASWKDDVLELMEKATCIVIKINDRDSCVWEILQARRFLNKTIFIVDDKVVYQNVIDKLGVSNFLYENLSYEFCYLYTSQESQEWVVVESDSCRFFNLSNELKKRLS